MNVDRALSDIAEMRAQLDRLEIDRGFRSAAVSLSVVWVGVGSWVQLMWVPEATNPVGAFLSIWVSVALLSLISATLEMSWRGARGGSDVWRLHRQLAEQLLPALGVGAILTFVVAREVADAYWVLPGLWSLIYSLGLFACRTRLPAGSVWIAVYFMVSGVWVLLDAAATESTRCWHMAISFGVGQAWLALLLFWNLERRLESR